METLNEANLHVVEKKTEKSLPKILSQYAAINEWRVVHVEEIIQNKYEYLSKHLFLDNIHEKGSFPNEIFKNVHKQINKNNFFAFKVMTAENVKSKLKKVLPGNLINFYYPFHFFFRRVLPKLIWFRKVYRLFGFTVDLSKSEIMGRLIYQGFSIISVYDTNKETVIIAKVNKIDNPSLTKPQPSEGVLFKMRRMGKNGEPITVYKFRSMHPYSEYVQEYMYMNNGLDIGGKFKDDFRISTGGKIIRKYWIDEIPMIINLLKGDIKLIGVRPISQHYFNLYPKELQLLRVKSKPGLLPPFYADMPETFEDIIESELAYLRAYQVNPIKTDFQYLFKIINNIFINNARSK